MALVSTERDRGTLAWTLTNPVSPTSVIAAKFVVALRRLRRDGRPAADASCRSACATVVYGGLPDLAIVGTFVVLFLALPAFYIALTVGLGTAIKSTVGVAGVAFAVMFVPQVLGGLLPIVNELSPTSIGVWALADREGRAGVDPDPIGWLVSMIVIVVGAKLVFDRQEF